MDRSDIWHFQTISMYISHNFRPITLVGQMYSNVTVRELSRSETYSTVLLSQLCRKPGDGVVGLFRIKPGTRRNKPAHFYLSLYLIVKQQLTV